MMVLRGKLFVWRMIWDGIWNRYWYSSEDHQKQTWWKDVEGLKPHQPVPNAASAAPRLSTTLRISWWPRILLLLLPGTLQAGQGGALSPGWREGIGANCNGNHYSVPQKTQWFCWSLSLLFMAIIGGIPHFQTYPFLDSVSAVPTWTRFFVQRRCFWRQLAGIGSGSGCSFRCNKNQAAIHFHLTNHDI